MNALLDTLRQRRIEALARRAAAHQGEARRLLANKQHLLQASINIEAAPAGTAAPPRASALAGLLADIARHSPKGAGLKTVREHRSTWAQLHVDQRLHQAQSRLPDNAGPLNTQRLLLQALSLMRDTSPPYLQHFMAHAETLLWLEATSPAHVQPRKEPARPRRRTPR